MYAKIIKFLKCKHAHFQSMVKGEIRMASITIRINEDEKKILAEAAKKDDLSMSQVIRRAIREYIAKYSQNQ